MRILHYTLGFPPYRSGGLVNYSLDLARAQNANNHEIHVMYPGGIDILSKKIKIKTKQKSDFVIHELINSLPLALVGGIKNPNKFCEKVNSNIYLEFLRKIQPDIIHVHTLMGIHYEFFDAAKKLNIPMVYTTHDYYGLSPTPTFFEKGYSYHNERTTKTWSILSNNAMDEKKLKLFQLKIYPLIRYLAKKVNNNLTSQKSRTLFINEDYKKLIQYYDNIFNLITYFHYNSKITQSIFEKHLGDKVKGQVISITTSQIKERQQIEHHNKNKKTNIAYIGPSEEYKGFFEFIETIEHLDSNKYTFHSYGYIPKAKIKNLNQHGKYNRENIEDVYKNIDILLVPSMWKETFGLIVLEAMSFGKKVYVSKNVGAKDLLNENFIFNNQTELLNKICFNDNINTNFNVKIMENHVTEIITLYNNLKRGEIC